MPTPPNYSEFHRLCDILAKTVYLSSMCIAVQFSVNDEQRTVEASDGDVSLPVMSRGRLSWIGWGNPVTNAICDPDSPGRFQQFPAGYWVTLDNLKSTSGSAWWKFKPQPTQIAVSAFQVLIERDGIALDHWINLRAGEFIQGAIATLFGVRRVYVVTTTPPTGYESAAPYWPRIVKFSKRRTTTAN
jgi:hypothetical protein